MYGRGPKRRSGLLHKKVFVHCGSRHDLKLPVDVSFGETRRDPLRDDRREHGAVFTRAGVDLIDKAALLDSVLCVHLWSEGCGRRKVRHDHILSDNVALPSDTDGLLVQIYEHGDYGGLDWNVQRLGSARGDIHKKIYKQKMAEISRN